MKRITVMGDPVRGGSSAAFFPGAQTVPDNSPGAEVEKVLGRLGFSLHSEREVPPEKADAVWCTDPSPELYRRVEELPPGIFKVLQARRPPIYAPVPHLASVLLKPLWNAVMTWNRAYEADYIVHYDIPFPDLVCEIPPGSPSEEKRQAEVPCVAAAPYRAGAFRFFLPARNRLCRRLARRGVVDLFSSGTAAGKKFPDSVSGRIALFAEYSCALVIEDMWAPGYVSERLMECILAGTPVVYFGDNIHAERRFPGVFVAMERLDESSFFRALELLHADYAVHRAAVIRCREARCGWNDSFLEAVKTSFRGFAK